MNAAQLLWHEYSRAWVEFQKNPDELNWRKMVGAFQSWKSSFLGSRRVN